MAITFADFRLDLIGDRLLHNSTAVPLRPKTWAVLRYLVERGGALVTRDQLLDALWPDTAVTPDTLDKSIGELRKALGDDRHAPHFIETAHGRGFRFLAETQRVGAVAAVRGASADVEARANRQMHPFVGRDEELQFLATRFARARAGERQIVFLTGPAGVGKTALVEAFLDSSTVRGAAAPVWIGRAGCFEHHGPREAYLPVLEALQRLARAARVERLVPLMRRAAPMWLAQMPWLVDDAGAKQLLQSLQGIKGERMPRELAVLIETLTTDVTLLLVLEDLHWSDPSTVDLLTMLGQRREPARLLVIGTYRPAEVAVHEHVLASAVRALRGKRQCAELPLRDLSEDAVRAYLALRFPGADFPPALAQVMHAHTGGNPLFVVAIVDHLVSRGRILDTAPGWVLSTPLETIDLGVPDDVRHMIEAQLHGLSPAERGLLEAASVAGNEITTLVLAGALGCEVDIAEQHCETLARTQQFLHKAGRIEWPGGGVAQRYAFTHELHRQVVYEEIPAERCARLHQRVGETLEAAYGAQAVEIAGRLVVHFERGRDHARALRYLIAAGTRARQRFAGREALGYLESALALLPLLPDRTEQRRWELQVRLALGRAQGDIGFAGESLRENYERASELCAALGSAEELFEVLYARWYFHALRADQEETTVLAAELDALAERTGTVEHRVVADSVLVRTAFYEGRFADAQRHMQSLLARLPERQDAAEAVSYGVDPLIAATLHYAGALWFLGDVEGARTAAGAGLARARESGSAFFLSAALGQHALVDLLCRNSVEGGALAEQAAELAAGHGFAFWNAIAMAMSGFARIQQGHASEGVDQLTRSLDALHATGTRFFSGYVHAFLAEGHLRTGAFAAGLAAAEAGLALAETALDRGYAPELWRLKGELLLAVSAERRRSAPRRQPSRAADEDWRNAERCLLRALALSRAAEAKSLELRAATSLAQARQARGHMGAARAALGEICNWFAPELATADLVEARALLAELTAPRTARTRRAGAD